MTRELLTTKLNVLILTLLFSHITLAQDVVFQKNIRLKFGSTNKREVLPIVGKNQEVTLILMGKKEITALELDQHFKEQGSYKMPRPKVSFDNLLGYSTLNKEYHLFFTDDYREQFFIQTIDVDKQQDRSEISELKLLDEIYLESFSYRDKFYLITLIDNASILRLYEFIGNDIERETDYDFSGFQLGDDTYFDLFGILQDLSDSFNQNNIMTKVAAGNPNSLEIASEWVKLYYFDDQLFITLDHNLFETQLININLATNEYLFETYPKPVLQCGNALESSNSYIFEDKLFQIRVCKSGLKMQVTDLLSKQVLSSYGVADDETVSFKNSAVRQEGSTNIFSQGTDKELIKTDKILRKIANSQSGISAYRSDETVVVTVGGFKAVNHSNTGGGFSFGGTEIASNTGAITVTPTYNFNPTMNGFGNYRSTRSVYFHSLLNKESYLHQEGEVLKNAFDNISTFEKETTDYITAETVFKVGNYFIYGYYDYEKWLYKLRLFPGTEE